MPAELDRRDCLLAVDVQKDFCPGGALAVRGADAVVPRLNRWMRDATAAGAKVVASRDWHPDGHVSFAERGGDWPRHCVRGTGGAEYHDDLELPNEAVVVSKGTEADRDAYSAFDGTGLAERLREWGVERVFVGGLALDYCVKATVLDGLAAGFDVHLIRDATRPVEVSPGDGDRAIDELVRAGARLEEER